jgi:hypothetical protein
MTTRERREARAARLREWADKREAKSTAAFDAVRQIADNIPMGQPILVGHHSEAHARRDQDRIHSGMRRAVDNQDTAKAMRQKAANIESAVDRAIYSDDPDAREQLERKIADMEAQRAAITAYNLDCRKAAKTGGHGNLSLLEWDTPSGLRSIARMVNDCATAGQLRPGWALPTYAASNLSGNIARLRKRLEGVAR